jgi:hypothetical protein
MKNKKWTLLLALALVIVPALAACAGGGDAPAQTVLLYHEALVAKDQDQLINYSCADWETQALLELDSFVSVETELVDASARRSAKTATQPRSPAKAISPPPTTARPAISPSAGAPSWS